MKTSTKAGLIGILILWVALGLSALAIMFLPPVVVQILCMIGVFSFFIFMMVKEGNRNKD